jgi:hypothetical protein
MFGWGKISITIKRWLDFFFGILENRNLFIRRLSYNQIDLVRISRFTLSNDILRKNITILLWSKGEIIYFFIWLKTNKEINVIHCRFASNRRHKLICLSFNRIRTKTKDDKYIYNSDVISNKIGIWMVICTDGIKLISYVKTKKSHTRSSVL